MRLTVAGLAFGVLTVSSAYAQYVISAHSGVVQYVEGSAYLNDKQVDPKFGQFPDIKQDEVFRTAEGRAEILLTPGVFLRVPENSSVRMTSNKLTDTRVEVLSGSAMVECDEISKDNAIMMLYQGNTMILVKHGLYRVDTDPARFQVYEGEAIVKGESGQLTLKGGKQTSLAGVLMAENFDKKTGDDLYRWSARRSSYLAKANVSSAMGLRNNGGYGSYGSSWLWNSMFGMYTFVPNRGIAYSPFGYGFWSPYSVGNYYYYNPGHYNSGGGGGTYRTPTSPYSAGQVGYTTGPRDSGSSSVVSTGGGFSSGGGVPSGGGVSSGGGMSSGGGVSRGGSSGSSSGGGGARGR